MDKIIDSLIIGYTEESVQTTRNYTKITFVRPEFIKSILRKSVSFLDPTITVVKKFRIAVACLKVD